MSDDADEYLPLTFFDEFWLLRDDLVPVNDTLDAVTLHLEVGTANHMWAQLKWQVREGRGAVGPGVSRVEWVCA